MTDESPASAAAAEHARSGIDTSVPHSARIWNYWLGGKDNYEIDRAAGDAYRETFPGIVPLARSSRGFLVRSVHHLAAEEGVRQFLDVGTGLPTADNTHEVAQRAAPDARIVYVDNDPLVLTHARALLTSTPEGATRYVDCDLREVDLILNEAAKTLDLTRPVGLTLSGTLGHVADYDEALSIVRRLMAGLSSGSYLALNDAVNTDPDFLAAQQGYDDTGAIPYVLRTPEQIAGYFDGLELLEPGLVPCAQWRPTQDAGPHDPEVAELAIGAVGRKP